MASFWAKFIGKSPSKVRCIFPPSLYADLLPAHTTPSGAASRRNAAESYNAAARECRERVAQIARDCRRTNEKFTDRDFDLEGDHEDLSGNCLRGLIDAPRPGAATAFDLGRGLATLLDAGVLSAPGAATVDLAALQRALLARDAPPDSGGLAPRSVHRVDWIFERPEFCVDGYGNGDVKQGADGDCWWLAAVCTLCSVPGLVERVCVAQEAECGVYGFVFHRDGEWVWTVVDDSLYLQSPDYTADGYDPGGQRARRWREREREAARRCTLPRARTRRRGSR